jgi:hypothetical protein
MRSASSGRCLAISRSCGAGGGSDRPADRWKPGSRTPPCRQPCGPLRGRQAASRLCRGGLLIGYARVSTQDQTPALQLDALKTAGCERIFVEKASGAQRDRPELKAALDYAREDAGDVVVVWKLDRLARSLSQLIDTADLLQRRGVGLKSLTEAIDTTSAGGRLARLIHGDDVEAVISRARGSGHGFSPRRFRREAA